MELKTYSDVKKTRYDNDAAKGVDGRVVIGKSDGAENFCMRVFEVAAGGHTPKHKHAWEHEIFFHSGEGEVFGNGVWSRVKAGSVVFIPGNEEHQFKNTGDSLLTFVCLIPSGPPEL